MSAGQLGLESDGRAGRLQGGAGLGRLHQRLREVAPRAGIGRIGGQRLPEQPRTVLEPTQLEKGLGPAHQLLAAAGAGTGHARRFLRR